MVTIKPLPYIDDNQMNDEILLCGYWTEFDFFQASQQNMGNNTNTSDHVRPNTYLVYIEPL